MPIWTLAVQSRLSPRLDAGGTALNLFVFEVPRLWVDIDLNYIGAVSRDVMLAERPKVEQAIQAVCGRAGMELESASSPSAAIASLSCFRCDPRKPRSSSS